MSQSPNQDRAPPRDAGDPALQHAGQDGIAPGHVLLVDDNPVSVEVIAQALGEEGHQVVAATSAAEALAHVGVSPVEVVICDLHMPDMDGFDLALRLSALLPEVPVIYASADDSLESILRAVQLRAFGYVLKRDDAMRLMPSYVRRALAHVRALRKNRELSDQLRRANEELEQRVLERTTQLEVVNDQLRRELAERRRVEEELAFRNLLLSTQQEASIDGILVIRKAGEILSYNRRFVDIWGIPADMVESRSGDRALETVLDKLADPAGFIAQARYLDEHTEESSRDELILRDGRILDRYSAPMLAADGRHLGRIWYFRDITAPVQAKQALDRRTAELERSNRELEQFAYVASHDLQEPLRMVASYTQLLAQRYQDELDDDARDFIQYAVSGAHRMQRLINDLLAYSRIGTRGKEPVPVDAHSALGRAVANLMLPIEESHGIVTNGELPVVNADEAQLVQVFQNLIENALKFCREVPPRVHVSAERQAVAWVFAVQDNGQGIAAEFFPRLFQIFQRLHSKQVPGTGIGLALCKRIVERHGGTIWVESVPGRGSTFRFSLPA